MANDSSALVQKLWNYCNVLRDDGVSYGDYVEQLTYLLFLKMDDEQTKPPFKRKSRIPAKYNWKEVIPQTAETLRGVGLVNDMFAASYLKDAHSQIKIFSLDGSLVREVELPGHQPLGMGIRLATSRP